VVPVPVVFGAVVGPVPEPAPDSEEPPPAVEESPRDCAFTSVWYEAISPLPPAPVFVVAELPPAFATVELLVVEVPALPVSKMTLRGRPGQEKAREGGGADERGVGVGGEDVAVVILRSKSQRWRVGVFRGARGARGNSGQSCRPSG
jgi:hypothetical protein